MATKKASTKSAPARKTAAKAVKKSPAKTVSRTSAKTTAKAKPQVVKAEEKAQVTKETPEVSSTVVEKEKSTKGGFKIKKSYVILGLVIAVLAAALFLTRSLLVAAVVNGQPIPRLTVIQEAEKQSGKQVMTTLVRNKLIEQEAGKQNVSVSDQEINEEIKKLEGNLQKQGQKLEQVLSMQGMTQEDLRKLIRLDKMVGKMVGKDIKITDQEVAKYIEDNKETLPEGQNEEEQKKQVKEQLKQQQLNEKVRTWLENLQKNAKIDSFVDYYDSAAK